MKSPSPRRRYDIVFMPPSGIGYDAVEGSWLVAGWLRCVACGMGVVWVGSCE